jgi:hypothetical protein
VERMNMDKKQKKESSVEERLKRVGPKVAEALKEVAKEKGLPLEKVLEMEEG